MKDSLSGLAALFPVVPLVESPFFEGLTDTHFDSETIGIARDLNRDGFAVIDFPADDIGSIAERIREKLNNSFDWEAWKNKEIDSLRIQDAWRYNEDVRSIAVNTEVLKLLEKLYGRRAFPFQTLNFPVGTQQSGHSDYVHFNSVPERFMCGLWVALEDTDEYNGPLFYYPSSHRWPSYGSEHLGIPTKDIQNGFPHYKYYVELWRSMAEEQGIKPVVFHAKQGQAVIWLSNLVHGGSVQKDIVRTRWSQVTHYYFYGCAYTTPVANNVYDGSIYYRDVIDIQSGEIVPNTLSGVELTPEKKIALRPSCIGPAKEDADKAGAITDYSESEFSKYLDLPEGFNPARYLALNPDVEVAGADPYLHYILFGRKENRKC